ncbi:nitroreductase family deazaflavin-dependent oxidoreductase [Streptomyces sp. NPDC057638]|uniref:nitroreductase family deazaflavin-dependent oxidoreductase n=1 Tax=Streptomyces sp. NPDC057638 TaxID=3346190 RepID=UPI00368E6416
MSPRQTRTVRIVRRVSSSRPFARVAPVVLPPLDRALHRLTRGRVLLSAALLPSLLLTVPGARTGLPRTTPLAALPEPPDSWLLIGSNFGRPAHPVWTANLLAHPDAEVSWHGETVPVRARLLAGEERAEAWRRLVVFWPPYATYQARVSREIRVFRVTRRAL